MKFRLIDIVLSALPAHEDTRYYVHKRAEEAAILVLVEEHTYPGINNNVSIALYNGGYGCGQPVYLCGGDDKHDDTDEYGEVTVGLTCPVNHELAVLLPPLPGGEEQAVALEVVLVHRHGDGDAERQDGGYTVASQLDRKGFSEDFCEYWSGAYLDVEDEVGRLVELRHLMFSLLYCDLYPPAKC